MEKIEDQELKEIQEMEVHYERACKLHEQYTTQVIMKRLRFQENCPHYETIVKDHIDSIDGKNYHLYHCKRCGKLINKVEK